MESLFKQLVAVCVFTMALHAPAANAASQDQIVTYLSDRITDRSSIMDVDNVFRNPHIQIKESNGNVEFLNCISKENCMPLGRDRSYSKAELEARLMELEKDMKKKEQIKWYAAAAGLAIGIIGAIAVTKTYSTQNLPPRFSTNLQSKFFQWVPTSQVEITEAASLTGQSVNGFILKRSVQHFAWNATKYGGLVSGTLFTVAFAKEETDGDLRIKKDTVDALAHVMTPHVFSPVDDLSVTMNSLSTVLMGIR